MLYYLTLETPYLGKTRQKYAETFYVINKRQQMLIKGHYEYLSV